MSVERNAANRDARWAALVIVLTTLGVLCGLLAFSAIGQQSEPSATPVVAPMNDSAELPIIRWLDRTLLPLLHYLGQHPVILALMGVALLYLLYVVMAMSVLIALQTYYDNDRKKCRFWVLVLWNFFEATAGTPGVFLRRTARHYWPVSFKPWEPDTAEGKTPPGSPG